MPYRRIECVRSEKKLQNLRLGAPFRFPSLEKVERSLSGRSHRNRRALARAAQNSTAGLHHIGATILAMVPSFRDVPPQKVDSPLTFPDH